MAGVETQREWRVGKACCEGTERGQTCADVSKEAGPGTQGAPFQLSEGSDLPNPFNLGTGGLQNCGKHISVLG